MEKFFTDHPEALKAFTNIQRSFLLRNEAMPHMPNPQQPQTPLERMSSIIKNLRRKDKKTLSEAEEKMKLAKRLYLMNMRYFSELMSIKPGDYVFGGLDYHPKAIGGPIFKYQFPFDYQNLSGRTEGIAPTILGRAAPVKYPSFTISEGHPPMLNVPEDAGIMIGVTHTESFGQGHVIAQLFVPWIPEDDQPKPINMSHVSNIPRISVDIQIQSR